MAPGEVRSQADSSQLSLEEARQKVASLLQRIQTRDPHETEFLQAVEEVATSVTPLFQERPEYLTVFELLAEPEAIATFRVPWVDDRGVHRTNRGFRVQFSSVLGPYKGGLRFHATVTLSVVKFLGFEQIFKNALTGLPLGGGKGGSDFDPKGKSDAEIMRFCQSFMTALARHLGPHRDVPAGDIGVGKREVGFLFGQYRRMVTRHDGVLTGKDIKWGGSQLRPEATGYGAVYFATHAAKDAGLSLSGESANISGSGNVALYAAKKLVQVGAKVQTVSDSKGTLVSLSSDGFSLDDVERLMKLKFEDRGSLSQASQLIGKAEFFPGKKPWGLKPCTFAFPSATQNEVDKEDAKILTQTGTKFVVEGANMPTTLEALAVFKAANVVVCPAKAANAGGVAVSGLEMSQNSMRLQWTPQEVDDKLHNIMKSIYETCRDAGEKYFSSSRELVMGANVAAFQKVADSIIEQGYV